MRRIISICSPKGGVGKTSTAINLSGALAKLKRKVLLIDMDPQGAATRGFGIQGFKNTVYEALSGEVIDKCIAKTVVDNVSIIPSDLRLSSFSYDHSIKDVMCLKNVLLAIDDERFDYIIIDCPPSMGLLNLNALAASNSVIVPVQCEYFALDSISSILASISRIKNEVNSSLYIEGFLLTMFDEENPLGLEVASKVKEMFKEHTFITKIPRSSSIAQSQAHQIPVTSFRPTSGGALAYVAFAHEVIDHE